MIPAGATVPWRVPGRFIYQESTTGALEIQTDADASFRLADGMGVPFPEPFHLIYLRNVSGGVLTATVIVAWEATTVNRIAGTVAISGTVTTEEARGRGYKKKAKVTIAATSVASLTLTSGIESGIKFTLDENAPGRVHWCSDGDGDPDANSGMLLYPGQTETLEVYLPEGSPSSRLRIYNPHGVAVDIFYGLKHRP